jgi:histidinol dehydrogenase
MKIWHLDREYDQLFAWLKGLREGRKSDVKKATDEIKQTVLGQGESALKALSRRFDAWELDYPVLVSKEDLEESAGKVSRSDRAVLKGMIRNVTAYHKGQLGRPRTYKRKGVTVTETFVPVERALVYVPGGTAPYPSSLVMGAVPARLAGVPQIYATTPAKNGEIHPHIAAAALLLDITGFYRLGGAQAIYAFSYGIGTVPKVDMIVGPGNAYVEEAKRDVFGQVGIDMLAGPSELIVLNTASFDPNILAWDLFSQAEHDEMATVGLFSPSLEDLYGLMKAMERLISQTPRKKIIERALEQNGFLVHYSKVEDAISAINKIAPEHLEVIGDESVTAGLLYPGVTYVGPYTCVSMGDYYIGTNHVLPTGGAGRFSAGLSTDRFTRRNVLVKIDRQFLMDCGDKAVRMSEIEGLIAHGEAIKARKELL